MDDPLNKEREIMDKGLRTKLNLIILLQLGLIIFVVISEIQTAKTLSALSEIMLIVEKTVALMIH